MRYTTAPFNDPTHRNMRHCVEDRETPGPLPHTYVRVPGSERRTYSQALALATGLNKKDRRRAKAAA